MVGCCHAEYFDRLSTGSVEACGVDFFPRRTLRQAQGDKEENSA
jgi:hypothetical protein